MSETDKLQEKQKLPIGFMDSGLGGLSVLREAIKLMPKEDFMALAKWMMEGFITDYKKAK